MRFHERVKEKLGQHAEPLGYCEKLLNDLQVELRRRFPLCHLDTDAIDDRLVDLAETISGLQSRVTPPAPVKEPEPAPEPVAVAEHVEPVAATPIPELSPPIA